MRKFNMSICLLLCIVSLLFFLNISRNDVYADSMPVITVESKEVHRGQTFELKVDLKSNPTGIACMQIFIHYDRSAMKLVNVKQGSTLSGINMTVRNPNSGEGYASNDFNILWSSEKADYGTGTIAILTFESYMDSYEGEYEVSFTYAENQTSTMDGENSKRIGLILNPGIVKLKKGAYTIYYVDYGWDQTEDTVLYKYEWNGENEESLLLREFPVNNPKQPSRQADSKYKYIWNTEEPWKGVPYDDPDGNYIIVKEANYIYEAQLKSITYKVAPDIDNEDLDTPLFANDPYWRENVVDFKAGDIFYYGETLVLEKPYRQDYTFYGWYLDESFSKRFSNTTMPDSDGPLVLYGYFKYNIREDNIPTVLLNYVGKNQKGQMIVDLELLDNHEGIGISSMLLEIQYEKGIKLVGIEDLALNNEVDNVKGILLTQAPINYESGQRYLFETGDQEQNNTYDTGKFFRLFFERESIDTIAKAYWVNVKNVKSLYVDESSLLWYTHINMKPDNGKDLNIDGDIPLDGEHYFTLPIGTRTDWTTEDTNKGSIDIHSSKELDINVELVVSLLRTDTTVDDTIRKYVDDDSVETSSSYDVSLVQNQVKLNIKELGCLLEVKVKLTDYEKESKFLGLFYVDGESVYEFKEDNFDHTAGHWHLSEDGEYLVFYTDHLSCWNIVSDKIAVSSATLSIVKIIILILPSIALAIIFYGTMVKNKQKETALKLLYNRKGGLE